jgi:hypothetical protein
MITGVRDHGIAPLAAGDPGEASGAGALFGQARDGMDDFLADRLARRRRAPTVTAGPSCPGTPASPSRPRHDRGVGQHRVPLGALRDPNCTRS